MLPALSSAANDPMRRRLLWAALAALALAQLAALWMLCSHQVRLAEQRHAGAPVEQVALLDCLQSVPGATLATCSSRMDVGGYR